MPIHQDPVRSAGPADPVATNSVADLNATAGDTTPRMAVPTPPPTCATRYDLGDEIARGGMGVVYGATDTILGREVAVKVLQDKFDTSSGAARRFADEARITGQLQHPAIPPVYDLGTLPDGRPFLAMKLIKGNTLDALLKARPDAGENRGRFVAVFEQVCQALAFAHAHSVIHRDLKPANVMVGNFGEVQVMDWGLAKVLGLRTSAADDPNETRAETEIRGLRESDCEFTQAGSILGTPAFMPPEQAIGAVDQVDARSDVFGLGSILCVILIGRPPFAGDTTEQIRQEAARGKVAGAFARLDACGADPELIALCKRCLAPEKADRPANGEEVAWTVAELRAAADERARRAEVERAADAARSVERRKGRRLAGTAAVVLAVALVGGLSAVLWVQHRANTDLAKKQAKVEKRFELAQRAIAKLHTGVSEDMLLKSDQFKGLRDQLLKEAVDFYGELEKLLEGETDAKSRRLLGDGYFRLADLTWRIGSTPEALAVHRKALAVRRELAAAPDADIETRLDVARSLNAISACLFYMGDAEGALKCGTEQQTVAAALATDYPTKAVQEVLAKSFINSGGMLEQVGKTEDALTANGKAVAILRKLVEDNPGDTGLQYSLAFCLRHRSSLLSIMGKRPEQSAALENARIILEKLVKDDITDARFRWLLGATYNHMASDFYDELKPAEALASAEKARAITQKIVDISPAARSFQWSLAGTYGLIGEALAELAKPDEAMASLEKASAIYEKLIEANATEVGAQSGLARIELDIGELLARKGRSGEALQFLEKARTRARKQAKAHQTTFMNDMEVVLASSLERIGLVLAASQKPTESLRACQEALAIREKLTKTQPTHLLMQGLLAESHCVLGRVQRRAGRPAEAAASFRSASAILEHLPTLTPRDHYNLACCHAQLAAVAANAGSGVMAAEGKSEAEGAMAALRQAVAAGFNAVGRLRSDASLDALRSREDFQKLVKELEEKAAKK
jgi:tetratricopeptide (TPR) repeat protein